MTSQQLQMTLFEESDTSTLSVEDFRVKLSALLGNDEGLKIQEELYFLKSQGSHLFSNLDIYSLKTSKDSLATTKEIPSRSSSKRWMNWGMMRNGKCLTAKILESPKTEKGCLLSDILEDKVDEKYFLSEEATRRLLAYKDNQQIPLPLDTEKHKGAGRTLLRVNSLKSSSGAMDSTHLKVKEATKKGFSEAEVGDSVNLSHPGSKTRRGRVGKGVANTLLTGESQGVVGSDFRIRKLTPRECWRLQGFPDCAFDKAQEVNSNSQLYKQAGNSVTVNVIAAIAKELD